MQIFKQLKLLSFVMMGLLSLSCSVKVADFRFCGLNPQTEGAACENFLSSDPETLNAAQWQEQIASWQALGLVVECTTSDAVANIKREVEQFCTKTHCTKDQRRIMNEALDREELVKKLVIQ
jgi:hypothetical protein